MSSWEALLPVAIIGVERYKPAWPRPDGALGAFVAGLDGRSPEARLLATAGVTALHRRAGRRPLRAAQLPPEPCPPDDRAACGSAAAARLAGMLAGDHPALLPEWLAVLATSGRRVPVTALPSLLDRGTRDEALRDLILEVIGTRGRWLAVQNPDWAWAIERDLDDEDWQTGERAQRLTLLRRLRRHEPVRARALLASTWAEETPDDRRAFLKVFADDLGPDDEAFLEAALDDRRKEVRSTAANLLGRLPGSALVVRMIERLQPLMLMSRGGHNGLLHRLTGSQPNRLSIVLPADWGCDRAMVRDGIEPTSPTSVAIGQKAWWLQQMLSVVPPTHWQHAWNVTPATALELSAATEWHAPLVDGWITATITHRDTGWAEALLALNPHQPRLLSLLPLARQEAILIEALQSAQDLSGDASSLWRLQEWHGQWSDRLARAALAWIRRAANQPDVHFAWQLAQFLRQQCAIALPPSVLDDVSADWQISENLATIYGPAIVSLKRTLRFRCDMYKELAV